MSRHEERERIRERLGVLTARVGATRAATEPATSTRSGTIARSVAASHPEWEGNSGRGRWSATDTQRGGARLGASDPPGNSGHAEPAGGHPDSVADAQSGRWNFDELPPDDPPRDQGDIEGVGEVKAPGWLDDPGGSRHRWRDRLVPSRFRRARMDPGRRGVLTMAGVGLVAALVTVVVLLWERPVAQQVPPVAAVYTAAPVPGAPPSGADPAAHTAAAPNPAPDGATAELVVSVVGLVHKSGLVRVPPGSRVADAVAAAGGAREGADLAGINLAQRLADGDQVVVGAVDAAPGGPRLGSTTIGMSDRASGTASSAAPGSATSSAPATRVNLNSAAESDLDALPGIGPVTARAIIAWRTTNGRFTDIEQLGDVDGIGPARLARLRDLVTI
ncbi:ComEA family DNA-binding protein [Nocardia cyriacigeorgica]|uniref:ComEA family DNA-binding protein n=1 Tax=Nocardia cyriacigeorgica TaxID=135487 RepID=UPI001C49B8AD|nr:ComEA family DNA-binding protein [Nocardia cyriacigeorgica]